MKELINLSVELEDINLLLVFLNCTSLTIILHTFLLIIIFFYTKKLCLNYYLFSYLLIYQCVHCICRFTDLRSCCLLICFMEN